MEAQIVGEGLLTLRDVTKGIKKSSSFAELLRKWRSFGVELELKDEVLDDLERRFNLGRLKSEDMVHEIIRAWKASHGMGATLKVMCDALEECGVRDISDTLEAKFCKTASRKGSIFVFQGKAYTWEQSVCQNVSQELYKRVMGMIKSTSLDKPKQLLRDEVYPKVQLEYYICRTLSYKEKLNEKIFNDESTRQHIFVFKGARKPEIARVCGLQMIESSRNQLTKITTNVIMLEREDDFEKLCQNTSKPVHLIRKVENSGFLWEKSSESLDVIRKFLTKNSDTSTKAFTEEDAIAKITSIRSPSAFIIADSPGMGKTVVLANLAKKIKETRRRDVVLFVTLPEFAKQIHKHDSAIDSILGFVSTGPTKKIVLKEMLKNTSQFFFFFDGYDEVLEEKVHLVDCFLQNLIKTPNIKVILTTRPHLVPQLENTLKRLSFEILPFNEINQIDFLIKYWTTKHEAKESETLKEFAKKCLNNLVKIMTDTEKKIAGIPLQCRMLAEVHAEDAIRASELEKLPEDGIKKYSFFQMYKDLIALKLSKVADSKTKRKYTDAHVYDSISLLFPEWLEKFENFLTRRVDINDNTLYSIGLLEKTPNSEVPRFVHRTFAEYVLANFATGNLSKSVDFLFKQILGKRGVTRENINDGPSIYKLKHPVISYFMNMHLQELFRREDCSSVLSGVDLKSITEEDACIAANACCCNDLGGCFELTFCILERLDIKDKTYLNDKYIRYILHLVVENTNNVTLVEKVLQFSKLLFGNNVGYHVYEKQYNFNYRQRIPSYTPLHAAAYAGKYNIVVILLREYEQHVLSINHLLHACVYKSAENTESVIEEKLSIVEALIPLNKEWLEEELEGRTPLLQFKVHEKIVKKLVEFGADINAYSIKDGTVLHMAGDKQTFSSVVRWALSNGFNLLNHQNVKGATPLTKAIQTYGSVDDEILQLLYEADTNFNAVDIVGDSVLFHGIKNSYSLHFIQKLLDFGANPNHTNASGRNAAHFVLHEVYKSNPSLAESVLDRLKLKAFQGINQSDKKGITPFLLGITQEINPDKEFLQFLYEEGVDFNAQDNNGYSVLLYAIWYSKKKDFIQNILDFGANPNHITKFGRNAAHLVMDCYHNDSNLAVKVLELLKSKGFDLLNEKDEDQRTPIMHAIRYKGVVQNEILQFLSKEGVDFNAETNQGHSVLFYAIEYSKNFGFIEKILDFGANPNHEKKCGKNAAHLVLQCYQNDPVLALDILRLLKSKGFDGLNKQDEDQCTPIMHAIRHTDIVRDDVLQYLSEEGVDFNAQDSKGNSVLFYAIQYSKNLAFIGKLLNFGGNPNHKNKFSKNAAHLFLILETCYDDPVLAVDILTLLKTKGFEGYNEKDIYGYTPIMLAIRYKGVVPDLVLQFLFNEGVDFNVQDNNGQSVLFYSLLYTKSPRFIETILDLGANPSYRKKSGRNAAHLVMEAYQNNPALAADILKILKFKGFDGLNEKDENGCTPLMHAIRYTGVVHDEDLQVMAEEGVDFNAQDNDGHSVLFYAISYTKRPGFILKILNFGANPNHKTKFRSNAAHQVLKIHQNDPLMAMYVLKLLALKAFEGFNEKDDDGCTPIMHAIRYMSVMKDEMLEFFLEKGVKFNACNNDGHSVLFYAIEYSKSVDFIKKILDFGANPNHKNKFGGNAAHLVLNIYQNETSLAVDVLKLLKSKGFDGFNETDDDKCTPIMHAIRYKGVLKDEIISYLSEEGVNFNAHNTNGHSVLFFAIQYSKNHGFIKNLLDFGANPNHKNKFGRNAAHLVLNFYQDDPVLAVDVLKLLKSRGFEGFNEMDNYGRTPVMHAIRFKGVVMEEILQFLSEIGVTIDFNRKGQGKNSVLFLAIQYPANISFVEKLLNCGAHPNHRNLDGQNAAHIVVLNYDKYKCEGKNQNLALEILKLLAGRRFRGFKKTDSKGFTPLKLAMHMNISDANLMKYLEKMELPSLNKLD